MLKGVKAGAVIKKPDTKNPMENVATNVLNYITMNEGGHRRYGMGFISVQVSKVHGSVLPSSHNMLLLASH